MNYMFNLCLANQYGVNEAIFLQNLFFKTKNNESKNKNYCSVVIDINGEPKEILATWVYSSVKDLKHSLPFWSEKQIRNIIAKCHAKLLIYISNLSQGVYNRTNWYALTEKSRAFFEEDEFCPFGNMHLPKCEKGFAQTGKTFESSNRSIDTSKTETTEGITLKKLDLPKGENGSAQTGKTFESSNRSIDTSKTEITEGITLKKLDLPKWENGFAQTGRTIKYKGL